MSTEPTTSGGLTVTKDDSISLAGDVAYVVLERDDSGRWSELKPLVSARSSEAAVKTAIGKQGKASAGTYVAIPRRSWKPVKVTAKVETTLVVEEAS